MPLLGFWFRLLAVLLGPLNGTAPFATETEMEGDFDSGVVRSLAGSGGGGSWEGEGAGDMESMESQDARTSTSMAVVKL